MENDADKEEFLSVMRGLTGEDEWRSVIAVMKSTFSEKESVCSFASRIGLRKGVSGYIYHTVPVAIYSWIVNYGDFEKTLSDVLDCGGDTDTTGAIAGALAGAAVGGSGIPDDWKRGLLEYPRGCGFILKVADALAEKRGWDRARTSGLFLACIVFQESVFYGDSALPWIFEAGACVA